jgi:hypothetical protein
MSSTGACVVLLVASCADHDHPYRLSFVLHGFNPSLLVTRAAIYEGMTDWTASLEIFQQAFSYWREKYGSVAPESSEISHGTNDGDNDHHPSRDLEA